VEESGYSDYLGLDVLLNAQVSESGRVHGEIHDQTLFIIAHQVRELWLKEILHELNSVLELFSSVPLGRRKIGLIKARLGRLVAVQRIMNRQIEVLETISPLDFLELRDHLSSDSMFESSQFREVELRLGLAARGALRPLDRFRPEERASLRKAQDEKSLFEAVDDWLATMPFRSIDTGEFCSRYRSIVHDILERDYQSAQSNPRLSGWELKRQLGKLENARYRFDALFKPEEYELLRDEGLFHFRQSSVLSALFLLLYRDEPLLDAPFGILKRLMDIDDELVASRIDRALFEQQVWGAKLGPGGSMSYDYVRETMEEKRIFKDLSGLATFLVSRSALPALPQKIKRSIEVHFGYG
jgi:tryptophan 2,3-dioxygenase